MQEGEVGRVGEAGAENAIVNDGEVEGRNEEVVSSVVAVASIDDVTERRRRNRRMAVVGIIGFDGTAYLAGDGEVVECHGGVKEE